MVQPMDEPIRFGPVEVRPASREVLLSGRALPLGARAHDVLVALIDRRDRVVGKDELLGLVWPGLVVEENNLQVQISTLRKYLGARTIATVVGRGYRFTAAVGEPARADAGGPSGAPAPAPAPSAAEAEADPAMQAWVRAREQSHTLPAERDRFVGRRDALAELERRYRQGARLVSLLGAAGSGKTRLAIHHGWQALAGRAGGAWFCDLAPARTLEGVVNAVAAGLGIPLGRADPVEQLGRAIAGRGDCLVILDNFEQVARLAEATLGRWLELAPEARFLATTREVLGIRGEETHALAPLGAGEAADLFMERAAAVDHRFAPDAGERHAIDELARLLDGLPLAIELAAARLRTLPPRALLARIDERFKLLAARGGRLDRQATLRAAFDWSWDLLGEAEKVALAQSSVFTGGFTLEAAESVLDLSAVAGAPWTPDVVQSLVEKSLVRACERGRFDLLVSVQLYAVEHLQTPGRFAGSGPRALEATRARHGRWFAQIGPGRAVEDGCAEIHNLVAACRSNVLAGATASAAGALVGAWAALRRQGPTAAGVQLARSVCAMPGLEPHDDALAREVLGAALDAGGAHPEAAEQFETALSGARDLGDAALEARLGVQLANTVGILGQIERAVASYRHAMQLARGRGEGEIECQALNGLGNLALDQGRFDESLACYDEALALARRLDHRELEANTLGNLGTCHATAGRLEDGGRFLEDSLAIARERGDRLLEGKTLSNLGMLRYMQRRPADSLQASEAARAIARELGYAHLECIAQCNVGLALNAVDELERAQAAFESTLELSRRIGDRRTEGQTLGYLGSILARRGRRADARDCLDAGQALLRGLDDPVSMGVLLCGVAELATLDGDPQAARQALEQARGIAARSGAGDESELGTALTRAAAMAAAAALPQR